MDKRIEICFLYPEDTIEIKELSMFLYADFCLGETTYRIDFSDDEQGIIITAFNDASRVCVYPVNKDTVAIQ